MPERGGGVAFWYSCAAVFTLAGLIVAWDSLNYYWNWDDLHLIRPYSHEEILGTLTGPWDPDGIETAGLRPITTVFNHVRALAFGEQVVLHRLFLLGLFSAFLVLLGRAAVTLGALPSAAVLTGIIVVTAKNNYYHFVWIADGVHVLQALFFAGALCSLLCHLDEEGGVWSGFLALVLAALALGTREDSLVAFPVLLLLGCYYASVRHLGFRRLGTFSACLICIAVLYWTWRSSVGIPDLPSIGIDARTFRRVGDMIVWTVCLAGQDNRPVCIIVGALAVVAAFTLGARERSQAFLWLLAALMTTAIGIGEARSNLLIFPVSFYAVFLASVAVAVTRNRRWMQAPAAGLMIWLVVLSVRASQLEQLSLHPMSAEQIKRDWEFIYGPFSEATIPTQRREVLQAKLKRVGAVGPNLDYDLWRDEIRRSMPAGDEVFIPLRGFLGP
ncbi:MAG: hypothetical protein HW416_3740 [Chloroflexi bacterium]|nr:hypothetical protein [Chloroflexota bacterium]